MLLLAYSAPGKDKTDAVKKKGGRAVGFCLTSMVTDRMYLKGHIKKILSLKTNLLSSSNKRLYAQFVLPMDLAAPS